MPTAKGYISDRTCPVCFMYFPSINQKIFHKRDCHKWVRTKLDDDYENGLVTDAECLPVRVLGPLQEGFYRVLFESGTSVIFKQKFVRLKRNIGPKKHVSLP